MQLSFSTKTLVVILLIGVCSTQTNARRLYKWVDQTSVTNYSEFQPKEGTSRKLEVLESRGNDHVDPAMAVTAEMKAIEIPVDQMNLQGQSSNTAAQAVQPATTQTVVKQGSIAAPYTRPSNTVVATTAIEKKEPQQVQAVVVEKKEVVNNPLADKAASAVVVSEKEEAVVVQAEKKVQPKINPWTRKVEFVPSNLVPQNLSKAPPTDR
ncbi:conserved hypothetical protein [Acinetobacter proteolyticus]|jgi:hypothetical protein|uniref:DUF4124 domain-containing protein n=1 Tax=Acinetobacter proteolyticus TaxID=1776741 RepID=A0A653K9E1_9GAMM|nr:hypothetical protein [Acinetobacter proteolyticus]VXA57402.1 conserved hypothetical protein [Acinetobacter proteolyticus]